MPVFSKRPKPVADPDPAALPDLVAASVAVYLATLSELQGLPIALEKSGDRKERPVLVVGCEVASERIVRSGVFDVDVRVSMETTAKTSDAKLLVWDGALWNAIQNTAAIPTALQSAQPGLRIFSAFDAESRAIVLNPQQRDIAYGVRLVAAKVAI